MSSELQRVVEWVRAAADDVIDQWGESNAHSSSAEVEKKWLKDLQLDLLAKANIIEAEIAKHAESEQKLIDTIDKEASYIEELKAKHDAEMLAFADAVESGDYASRPSELAAWRESRRVGASDE